MKWIVFGDRHVEITHVDHFCFTICHVVKAFKRLIETLDYYFVIVNLPLSLSYI